MVAAVRGLRGSLEGFEVVAEAGPDAEEEHVGRLAAAGATWVVRSFPVDATCGEVRRLAATPPWGEPPGLA